MTQRIVSLGFLAAAVVVLAQAFAIQQGEGYQAVGPRAFPLLVGGGLAVVSVIGVVQAFRPGTRAPATAGVPEDGGGEAAEKPHWPSVLLLIGSLAAYALLLVPAGYWQATTAFFVAVARVLGSRRLVRDLLVGLALALATYFLFDRLLGITLPPGLVRLAI
ncbi:tripartite tricarboxylate transporter TctB family protein [Nonomuraea jabiensis]|uniref:Putative tricarboxylic transport membrane protein n=1 Tax=Nonomuraea jabiensis TaxID=882448 RepID=A0A7W9G726_9ACTN|nr:tripartite tricarboxylate transporter TctB family protein [Nonomuraea jabiensis]MBB5778329.1 putative tricarboxylic transport membrane protein [Nonomuraea jabiensis]